MLNRRGDGSGIVKACRFSYDASLLRGFPTLVSGVIFATGFGAAEPSELRDVFREEQEWARDRLAEVELASLPSIAAWRRAFRQMGVNPTRYRPAAEALLRRLSKHGRLPEVSPLVDVGQLLSLRHAVPVAVLDAAAIDGPIVVRFADGSEEFRALDAPDPAPPDAGEVIFADSGGRALTRRWCWKQSLEGSAQPETRSALIVIEALHEDGADCVRRALEGASTWLDQLFSARVHTAVLDAEHPATGELQPPGA